MTAQELLRDHVPAPKRCMADKFDSKPGTQCDGARVESYIAWLDVEDEPDWDPNVRVWLCSTHDIYRKNGGSVGFGPVVLRAAAGELFRKRQIRKKK